MHTFRYIDFYEHFFNALDLVNTYLLAVGRPTVQTIKFLIVEPSPLPNLIPLGPKYSPHDPVFKYP